MFQHEIEVEIDKPLKEVYAAFNNPDNMPRWLTGLQRVVQVRGERGQVGSVSKQIYLERGRTVEMIETITAHEPERFFEGTLEAPGMKCDLRVDFSDRGDKTLLRFGGDFQACTFLMRILMPFMKGSIQRRQCGDMETFKELVEAGEI